MRRFIVNFRGFRPIVDGLIACGYDVLEDLWNPTDTQLADCEGYLICMYNAMKRPVATLRLKSRLHARNIPLIGWNRDGPWNKGARRWRVTWFRALRILDLCASHSLQSESLFARESFYLPNAAWATHYNLAGTTLAQLRDPARYRYDVSFVGNLDPEGFPEFGRRAEFFRALEQRLAPLGVKTWFHQAHGMPVAEQVDLIQRSRININFGAACDDGQARSWGLPERCYGIPACGGFLLSEAREHASEDFRPGEEWIAFRDLDDCVGKIQYYLAHHDEARTVAERAHARILQDHTYTHRAARLAQAARDWRQRTVLSA